MLKGLRGSVRVNREHKPNATRAHSAASAGAVAAEPLDLTPVASERGLPGRLALARATRFQYILAIEAACESPRNNIASGFSASVIDARLSIFVEEEVAQFPWTFV